MATVFVCWFETLIAQFSSRVTRCEMRRKTRQMPLTLVVDAELGGTIGLMASCGVELRQSGDEWFGEMFKGAGLASRNLSGNGPQLYLECLCGGIGHAPLQLPAVSGAGCKHATRPFRAPASKHRQFNTAPRR